MKLIGSLGSWDGWLPALLGPPAVPSSVVRRRPRCVRRHWIPAISAARQSPEMATRHESHLHALTLPAVFRIDRACSSRRFRERAWRAGLAALNDGHELRRTRRRSSRDSAGLSAAARLLKCWDGDRAPRN